MARVVVLLMLAAFLGVDATEAQFTSASQSPGNTIATGGGTWFSGTGIGAAICAGTNVVLTCSYGAQPGVGKITASIGLQNKSVATTYTLTVVDGTGPAGISTIVTATFRLSGNATAILAAGTSDTMDVVLKTKGNTPTGSYAGTLVIADTTSGLSVAIPLSLTH